jgi:hypothetical protein
MEGRGSIQISDIRGRENSFSFEKYGFEILSHESKLSYEDFYDPKKIPTYLRELEAVLKKSPNAAHVEVFRHGVSNCITSMNLESES